MGSYHEKGKTLNIPKDAIALDDGDSSPDSAKVQIVPKIGHLVTTDATNVRTTEDAQKHLDGQNSTGHEDIRARESSKKNSQEPSCH